MTRTLVLPFILAAGCAGSVTDVARTTLTTAAYATVQSDKSFSEAYELASTAARESSTTQAEKDAKMVDWEAAADKLEAALRVSHAALVAAEVALDGYERTKDAGHWDEALGCVAESLREAMAVLEERGLKIPAALAKVLALSEGLTCSGGLQ
jgi:hypothetical protein